MNPLQIFFIFTVVIVLIILSFYVYQNPTYEKYERIDMINGQICPVIPGCEISPSTSYGKCYFLTDCYR